LPLTLASGLPIFSTDLMLVGRWPLLLTTIAVLLWRWFPRSGVRASDLAREVGLVMLVFATYFFTRANVDQHYYHEALDRASDIIRLERDLGIHIEPHLQDYVLRHPALLELSNAVYQWGHWPVIVSVALWLFFHRRDDYPVFRNAFVITCALGIVLYALFPTAPPRFMEGWGFVDTIYGTPDAAAVEMPAQLVNEYASMPSLHLGWNVLVSVALVRHAPAPWARLLGIAMPAAMFLAIVATGNHYVIDALAGTGVALTAIAVATLLQRASRWTPQTATAPA
jgi:hypothetical protein